jgi:hypothetical protein
MKIAVLIPGHIRAWEVCKENFMNTIYDTNHMIDVFIDTYNEIYRNDYSLHNENGMNISEEDNNILSLFGGINVVDFKIEKQIPMEPETAQIRKILKVVNAYEKYENENGKYDLVIRTRFDILLDEKLDYKKIYNQCKDSKLIYIANGAVHREENDMFAICNSDTFKIYGRRFYHNPYVHSSMITIKKKYGIQYSQTIGISIVRLGGPGKSINFNGTNYTIFK